MIGPSVRLVQNSAPYWTNDERRSSIDTHTQDLEKAKTNAFTFAFTVLNSVDLLGYKSARLVFFSQHSVSRSLYLISDTCPASMSVVYILNFTAQGKIASVALWLIFEELKLSSHSAY